MKAASTVYERATTCSHASTTTLSRLEGEASLSQAENPRENNIKVANSRCGKLFLLLFPPGFFYRLHAL
jgi:hypothetical protein